MSKDKEKVIELSSLCSPPVTAVDFLPSGTVKKATPKKKKKKKNITTPKKSKKPAVAKKGVVLNYSEDEGWPSLFDTSVSKRNKNECQETRTTKEPLKNLFSQQAASEVVGRKRYEVLKQINDALALQERMKVKQ
ncbi:unnamed protein product [Boreogadus saida]